MSAAKVAFTVLPVFMASSMAAAFAAFGPVKANVRVLVFVPAPSVGTRPVRSVNPVSATPLASHSLIFATAAAAVLRSIFSLNVNTKLSMLLFHSILDNTGLVTSAV